MIANDLTQPNNLNAKFLPFEKFHLAPVTDVTAEAIKNAAFLATTQFKDSGEPELEQTTAQNYVVKSLGFTGGFGEFVAKHQDELDAFKKSHGMETKADLIRPLPILSEGFRLVSLTPRQLADRLFDLSKSLPQRVFTGYNLDFFQVNNRWHRCNPWAEWKNCSFPEDISFDEVATKADALGNLDIALIPLVWDSAFAALWYRIGTLNNLIGDQLLDFDSEAEHALNPRVFLYQQSGLSDEAFAADMKRCIEAAKIFRYWIMERQEGWVKVIRYNEKLIFLKGPNGSYDFVFPGLRDEPFKHQVFENYIHNDDFPNSSDAKHFPRWLYHEYRGNLELDRHEAEKYYYANGGQSIRIPKPDEMLKSFLTARSKYEYQFQVAKLVSGYHQVEQGGRKLNVSNLITVSEFREFMADEKFERYRARRARSNTDSWESVNQESEASLPAAVTWYDANAFATWVKKRKGLPVRLLTEAEYLELAEKELGPANAQTADPRSSMQLCILELDEAFERWMALQDKFHEEGRLTPEEWEELKRPSPSGKNEPDKAGEDEPKWDADFQARTLTYDPEALVWKIGPSGLKFLISGDFGEWLDEFEAALSTLDRGNLCNLWLGFRRRFPPHSTGKYKGKKIGFRLCYLDGEPKPPKLKKSKKSDQT